LGLGFWFEIMFRIRFRVRIRVRIRIKIRFWLSERSGAVRCSTR